MGIVELIKAAQETNMSVNINIEGKQAVKISAEGNSVNVDVLDTASLSKILSNLK